MFKTWVVTHLYLTCYQFSLLWPALLNKRKMVLDCISFLLLCNKLPKTLRLETTLIISQFPCIECYLNSLFRVLQASVKVWQGLLGFILVLGSFLWYCDLQWEMIFRLVFGTKLLTPLEFPKWWKRQRCLVFC